MPARRFSHIPISWKHILLIVAMVAGIGIVSIGTAYHRALAQAFTLATTHQPERFTELYFDKPATLPNFALHGKSQTIDFSLVNHEAEARAYTYEATLTIGSAETVLSIGTMQVGSGATATEQLHFVIPKPDTTATVDVYLLGTDEHIEFRSHS